MPRARFNSTSGLLIASAILTLRKIINASEHKGPAVNDPARRQLVVRRR